MTRIMRDFDEDDADASVQLRSVSWGKADYDNKGVDLMASKDLKALKTFAL